MICKKKKKKKKKIYIYIFIFKNRFPYPDSSGGSSGSFLSIGNSFEYHIQIICTTSVCCFTTNIWIHGLFTHVHSGEDWLGRYSLAIFLSRKIGKPKGKFILHYGWPSTTKSEVPSLINIFIIRWGFFYLV